MDLSIITVNFNTKEHVARCLDSIARAAEGLEVEVFVVDNDSRDGSQSYLASLAGEDNFHVILNKENVGFARANNQAMRLSAGRYIMLINPDAEVLGKNLTEAVRFMDETRDVGIMGPSILSHEGKELKVCRKYSLASYDLFEWMPLFNKLEIVSRNYRNGDIDYRQASDVDYIQGACMIMRRAALDETGLLDERYFMYGEEEDLCRRMKEKGWRVVYNPGVAIMHHWGASTRKERFQKFDILLESKYLYFRKFYGKAYAGLYIKSMTAVMWMRIVYYSVLMLQRSRLEASRYEKELSRYLLGKLGTLG